MLTFKLPQFHYIGLSPNLQQTQHDYFCHKLNQITRISAVQVITKPNVFTGRMKFRSTFFSCRVSN